MQNKVLNFPNLSKISILSHSELINLMNTDEHGTAVHCEIDVTDENYELKMISNFIFPKAKDFQAGT